MLKYITAFFILLLGAVCLKAVPIAAVLPDENGLITVPNTGDGQYTIEKIQGKSCWKPKEGSSFLYLQLAPELMERLDPNAYAAVTVICTGSIPAVIGLENTSQANTYETGTGFGVPASGKWTVCLGQLRSLTGNVFMNNHSNVRLKLGSTAAVAKIELYNEKPPITDTATLAVKTGFEREAVQPGDITVIFGNDAGDPMALLYKSLGAAAIESYVTWETVEREGKGKLNWSHWDRQVEILDKYNMKWVPFVILGPAYSIPAWFRASREHVPCRCLEHGTDSKIESLWNPYLTKHIRRFLKAFAERYGSSGVIDTVLLGIQGDYGEAIYSVSGGGWTFRVPGEYHNHYGFWCGDPYAKADFVRYIRKKYTSVSALNNAWHTAYTDISRADFPFNNLAEKELCRKQLPQSPGLRRHYLDFVAWYRSSMTELADKWMTIAREYMPDVKLSLCTGGDCSPEQGGMFAEQCRIAAKHRGGIRVTNENSDYAGNFFRTRWSASAAKHYGCRFGFEPAGAVDLFGMTVRIYNAAASGADEMHEYNGNVTGSETAKKQFRKHCGYLSRTKPIVPIALWYPDTSQLLKWDSFGKNNEHIRDLFDCDIIDGSLAESGALRHNRILIITCGSIMETHTAKALAEWAEKGGHILVTNSATFESVEGTDAPERLLFPKSSNGGPLGKGSVTRTDAVGMLKKISEILACDGYPVYDMKEDGVFVTQTGAEDLLILNTNTEDKELGVTLGKRKYTIGCKGMDITKARLHP